MSELSDLLSLLPQIIVYLAAGFLFLQVFHFIASIQNPSDYQHVFMKSLIVGFVICSCLAIIPIRFKYQPLNLVLLLLICVGMAYLTGRIYGSSTFRKVLKCLHISRTVNPYIWNDIDDFSKEPQSLWVYLEYRSIGVSYYGLLITIEDFQRYPQIVLGCYTKIDSEYPARSRDFSKDPTQRVLLDTDKADLIELVYNEASDNIKIIKEKIATT